MSVPRSPLPPCCQREDLGLQSNFQSSVVLPCRTPARSKLYSQPSPPAKIACHTPPSWATAGDDEGHVGSRFAPGDASDQTTRPVRRSKATNDGASGAGILSYDSSVPLDVLASTSSPAS